MIRTRLSIAGITIVGLVLAIHPAGSTSVLNETTLPEILRIDLGLDYDGSPVGSAADFDVAPDETVYILDSRGGRVLRFDAGGKFLGAFGRPGQGPGDLQRPLRLVLSASGEVIVGDDHLSVFSSTGRFLHRRSERLPDMVDAIFNAGPDGYFVSRTGFLPSAKGVIMERAVEKTDTEFHPVKVLFRRSAEFGGGKSTSGVFFTFAPGPEGEIYVLNRSSREYRILAFDPTGTPRPDITRPYRPIAKCPETVEAEKNARRGRAAAFAAREGGSPSAGEVDPNKFAVEQITVDKAGRLWATTFGPEPCDRSVYVDVFGPDGAWKKRFLLGPFFSPQIKIKGDSLFLLDGEAAEEIVFVRFALGEALTS